MAYPANKQKVSPSLTKFVTGGCLDYAEAYVDVNGGELYVIVTSRGTEHVVVKDGEMFFDVFGGHSEEEIKTFWTNEARSSVEIAPATNESLMGLEEDEARYNEALALVQ